MVSIDLVRSTVLFFVNSDTRGNVKPDEVVLAINNTVNEIIEEYFTEVNRVLNRENRGLVNGGLENIADRYREKISHFLKFEELAYDDGFFNLPEDYRYIDAIFYDEENEIEPCKNAQEFKLILNLTDTRPTTSYPVFLKTENKLKVAPPSIEDKVKAWYLRKHKIAKWTFVLFNGNEMFNPSAPDFQDIDLHPSEEANVIIKTLQKFGVNLKETDLQSYAQNKQTIEFNEENAL